MRRVLAGVGAVLFTLTGCDVVRSLNPVDLTPSGGVWDSARGPTIEFTADGYFYADDIGYTGARGEPVGLGTSHWDARPASGQWELSRPGGGDGALSVVTLIYDVVDGRRSGGSSRLQGQRVSDELSLIAFIGDPDNGDVIDYRRCGQCQPLAPDGPTLGTPTFVDPDSLQGVWRDQRGGELVIGPDGRFAADDLVARAWWDVDGDRGLPDDRLSVEGSWSQQPPGYDPEGAATTMRFDIELVAGEPRVGNRRLRVLDAGDGLVLAMASSDPSVVEPIVFHRAP